MKKSYGMTQHLSSLTHFWEIVAGPHNYFGVGWCARRFGCVDWRDSEKQQQFKDLFRVVVTFGRCRFFSPSSHMLLLLVASVSCELSMRRDNNADNTRGFKNFAEKLTVDVTGLALTYLLSVRQPTNDSVVWPSDSHNATNEHYIKQRLKIERNGTTVGHSRYDWTTMARSIILESNDSKI